MKCVRNLFIFTCVLQNVVMKFHRQLYCVIILFVRFQLKNFKLKVFLNLQNGKMNYQGLNWAYFAQTVFGSMLILLFR